MESTTAGKQMPAFEKVYPPRAMTRYLINPIMRVLVDRRLASDRLLVLHFSGRRTGRQFAIPVVCHPLDDSLVVLTTRPWCATSIFPAR